MEKISGILPKSVRTGSNRFNDKSPVRPGAPAFGRPQGSSEIKDRVSLTNAQELDLKPYKNPKDANHVKIVDKLARDFFMEPEKMNGKGLTQMETDEGDDLEVDPS